MSSSVLKQAELFLKLAENNFCFFVDWDETLAHYYKGDIEHISDQIISAKLNDDKYILKRLYVEDLLKFLKSIGKVYLCTHGTKNYIKESLEKLNLSQYFINVYTRDEIWKTHIEHPICDNFILIDNLPESSPNSQYKLKWITGNNYSSTFNIDKNYLQVKEFKGKPDDELLYVIEKLKNILSSS